MNVDQEAFLDNFLKDVYNYLEERIEMNSNLRNKKCAEEDFEIKSFIEIKRGSLHHNLYDGVGKDNK